MSWVLFRLTLMGRQETMVESDPKIKQVSLFSPGDFTETSPVFAFKNQVTIRGIGLIDGDEITFKILKVKAGDLGQQCDCTFIPSKLPEVEAIQPLLCEECTSSGEHPPIRLTPDNPVIVLDAPQNALMIAEYKGDGLGMASVLATFNTTSDVSALDPGMRGCPASCEAVWKPTGRQRCNLDLDKMECHEEDGLGNERWVECGDLVWTNTGEYQITAENKVQRQQTDQCGDLRWVDVDESEIQWSLTGDVRCVLGDDEASATYVVEHEYTNQFGQIKWEAEETRDWTDTGVIEDVGDGTVRKQQTTICNDLRWVLVDADGIVWTPTGNIRCSGFSDESDSYTIGNEYRSQYGQIKWEDNDTGTWADTGKTRANEAGAPEKQQVTQCGNVRWKAVDTSGAIWTATGRENCIITEGSDTYQISRQYRNQYGQVEWRTEETREWTDTGVEVCINHVINKQQITVCNETRWKPTETPCGYFATLPLPGGGAAFRPGQQPPDATVELKNCADDVTIGWLYPEPKADATVAVKVGCDSTAEIIGYAVGSVMDSPAECGCCGTTEALGFPSSFAIKSIPSLTVKGMPALDIHIKSVPRLAVGTFEKCQRMWILYNDGTYEPVDITCPQDKPIVPTIVITYENLFSAVGAGDPPAPVIARQDEAIEAAAWPNGEPDNVMFRGWSLSKDCKTVDFAAGDVIDRRYSVTLYAVWEFIMGYTSDEGSENVPAGQSYNPAVGVTVSEQEPTRAGYTFLDWEDTANGNEQRVSGEHIVWAEDQWSSLKPSMLKAAWQA